MGVQINGDTGNISATKADYSGNVTIGGTLTYEDVTNIDSVGLITARNGIEVGARPGVAASISVDGNMIVSGVTTIGGNIKVGTGVTLSPDGDGFFTGVVTATSYSGIDLGAVTGATGDFSIADKIVHTGDTDTAIRFSAADTISIETGGITRATVTGNTIDFPDAGTLRFGASNDLQIYHGSGGASNIIHSNTSQPLIINASGAGTIRFDTNSNERARISSTGQLSVNTTADITGANVAIGGSVRLVNPTGQSATISALPSGTYNTGHSGGSAIVFHRFSDGGGGSDEIAFETHHQGNRHGEAARFNKSGNLAFPNGQGIDFSARSPDASGMTSELLDDYEEGTFTPTCVSGGFGNWSANVGRYTKIGRLVNISWEEGFNSSGDGSTLIIGGLPYIADDWTPGSMYAGSYSDESSQMATPAVPASTATIKVITWGAEATGNKFGTSTYSAWNITYTTSQ